MPVDPIRHVVVLILENHSFDQMLGGLTFVIPDIDGVNPAAPGQNKDIDGKSYSQAATTETSIANDPKHDLVNVLRQIDGANSNFLLDFTTAYPDATPEECQQVMGYFPPRTLGPLHELAQSFTICDRWYSSVPGPTWTNRFFVHSGTSLGRVEDARGHGGQPSQPVALFRLRPGHHLRPPQRKEHFLCVYHGDFPQSIVLTHQRTPRNATHYEMMGVFFSDAQLQEQHFPAYSFIEPSYFLARSERRPPAAHDRPCAGTAGARLQRDSR